MEERLPGMARKGDFTPFLMEPKDSLKKPQEVAMIFWPPALASGASG